MHVSDDAFLGGALNILQPRQGYRAGLDAVFLAASVPCRGAAPLSVLDVGAGVGTAGLCVAWRCRHARVALIEREPDLVALARENIARNGLSDRVSVIGADISRATRAELLEAGLPEEAFDHVIANPPFHAEGAGTPARHALKAAAHAMAGDGLDAWGRFMARMARPGGEAILVHKAEALPEILLALQGRFGGASLTSLHSRAGEAANRVIVRGLKGSRAPFAISPGRIIHDQDNRLTRGADGVLRLGLALDVAYGDTARTAAQ